MARTWFSRFWPSAAARRAPAVRRARPRVEMLEERALLDTGLGQNLSPTASERYITGLYYDVLHRQPTQAEVNTWIGSLHAGASRMDVASAMLNSPEDRIQEIQRDYQTLLGRAPEPAAIDAWLSRLEGHSSNSQQLEIGILASDEYYLKHGGQGPAWVTALYADVLHRNPDPAGLAYFNRLVQVRNAHWAIATRVVYSPEAFGVQTAEAYQDLLGRNPDAAGQAFWVHAMQSGQSLEQVRAGLLASAEYANQQAGVDLPLKSAAGTTTGGSTAGAAGSINLSAPAFTTSTTPTITIDPGSASFAGRAWVDVDLNGNGVFSDAGEQFQTTGFITPDHHQLTLNSLPRATYLVRATVRDVSGATRTSQTVRMNVDPAGGILGSQVLQKLADDFAALGNQELPPTLDQFKAAHPLLNFDAQGRVEINVHATTLDNMDSLRHRLQQWEMNIVHESAAQQMFTGFLSMHWIKYLPALPEFYSATPVYRPYVRAGSTATQGDRVIGGDAFRATGGFTGAGITVGVLSDSVNRVDANGDGVGGLLESQLTHDLPTNIRVLEDGPSAGATDEGRAMMEIIHDIAPGAALAFHTATITPQDFAAGIDALTGIGAKVLVDDVGYLNSPFFNDGIVAQAVDRAAAHGVFYASAAGNDGRQGYLSSWHASTATVGGVGGTYFDLGRNQNLQHFSLDVGQSFTLDFQWDNAFLEGGSSDPAYQVKTEIDVYITTGDGSTILEKLDDNTLNTNEALQLGTFTNDGSFGTNDFAFAFLLKQGPAPTMIRWVASGDDPHAQGEGGPTIFGQPAARGAVAVGAVEWDHSRTIEPYSSTGGQLPFLFDAQGHRLTTPEIRTKADVAAPDGVDTSFFGVAPAASDPDQHLRFFGTSAAAPHVAGAAALLLQQFPTATPAMLREHLTETAIAVSTPGQSGSAGAGLIQVVPLGNPDTGTSLPDDRFESNDHSNSPTLFGLLTAGAHDFFDLSINTHANGLPDYDWYAWAAATSGTVTVSLGYQSAGDLHVRLYTLDASGGLVQLAAGRTLQAHGQTISAAVALGEPLLVWVYGFNHAQGTYNLTIRLG